MKTYEYKGTIYHYPKIGEDIYVPSSFYLSHGADDFCGGLCEITNIIERPECPNDYNRLFVTFKGVRGEMNWLYLMEGQEKWAEDYGDKRGHPCPDYTPEFNRWD